MSFHILRTSTPRARVPESQLEFGQVFTDHMLLKETSPGGTRLDDSPALACQRWQHQATRLRLVVSFAAAGF